jgi:hypothetical protein
MRKIGIATGVMALAAIALAPSPSSAFGVRIGPFYLGIPFFGHRHHHHHYHHAVRAERQSASLHDEAAAGGTSAREPASRPPSGLDSPLLYPTLALPAAYDDIFWPPASSPWPFSYEAIFRTAFAKPHTDQSANACPQAGRSSVVGERIRREITARGVQLQLLQRLNGALVMAANYLAKACPNEVPANPVARLQLMEWQIEKLAEALDIVRPPLQAFEQSLNTSQQARFAATPAAASDTSNSGRTGAVAGACAAAPTMIDSSVEQISQSVQPTKAQHDAVTAMRHSLHTAAAELDATCSLSASRSPLARLEAIQSHLDATWRAVLAIQVALDNFGKQLDDEQRARLDSTDFAAAQ